MSEAKTELKFESWSVPEAPFIIEYAQSTLEEIRAFATEGFKRLSRGGVEEGGVLFGARGENLVRVVTWRPIQCEHLSGPALQLSQNDRIALGQFLQAAKTNPELSGLHPVGWFVSHTRAGICLAEADVKTYNHFFPWSWQVTLVLEPSKQGSAKAGFFFRDVQGEIKADASYREFTIEAGTKESRIPPARALESAPRMIEAPREQALTSRLPAIPRRYQPEQAKSTRLADRRLWIWAVPLILALLVGAMLIDRPGKQNVSAPLAFRVADAGGELRLEWDRNSESIKDAVRGTLDVRDGNTTVQLPLPSDRLREGTFQYTPKSGDLELRLTVYPQNGNPVQESTRFVGSLGAITEDAARVRQQRDELVNEVDRLREQLRRTASRNHELEEAVRILENRVQVENLTRPSNSSSANK